MSDVKSSYVPFAFDIMRKSLLTISVIKDYDYVLSPIKHSKKKKSARRGRRVIVHTMMLLPSESGCSEGLKFVIKSSKRKDQQEELGRNMCSRLQVK